jgi:two-component system LytT family sensor kinase
MKKYVVVLLHSGYWLICLFVMSMISLIDTHGTKIEILSPVFIGSIIPASIGFYSFYGVLFDKYLAKKKLTKLLLSSALIILISAIITEIALYFLYTLRMFQGLAPVFFAGLIFSFISLINGILGLVMKGFITWYNEIKIKIELNKKNHEMELALMKAQINPHFLFNTINNVDGLIKEDPDKASEYLNKLSDMMRFMLYETKTNRISLAKELSHIEKYLELQKIRTTNPKYVNYMVQGDPGKLMVESMLFIPFIENAFKHTEDKKIENAIKIRFVIEKDKIVFECENAYFGQIQLKPEYSGLGNDLIQRRLALLYNDKYILNITSSNGIYKVNLVIPF